MIGDGETARRLLVVVYCGALLRRWKSRRDFPPSGSQGSLSQALQQQVEEANSLRVQRDEARLLAASRRATLEHSRSEVTALQAQVTELKNVIGPSPDQLDQLHRRESALAEQEAQIARQAAELAQAELYATGTESEVLSAC